MSKICGNKFPNKNLKRKFLKKGIKSTPIIIIQNNIRVFLDEKTHPP